MHELINNWIVLLVALPMGAGVLTTLLRGHVTSQRLVGLTTLGTTLLLSVLFLFGLDGPTSMHLSHIGEWKPPYGIAIVFDGVSGVLLLVSSLVALACYLHSFSVLDRRVEKGWFHPLFHLLMMGVNFAFLTGDLFNLFVAFEIMLMASYALLTLGGSRQTLSQAYKYVILNLIGSTIFVLGAGIVYGMMGTLNYADLARMVAEAHANGEALPRGFQSVAVMLLLVFGLKGAIFPLWFWLPDTYHTLPTSIAGLFAALLSKIGVYAILRLFPMIFAAPGVNERGVVFTILAGAAFTTMIVAILGAFGERRIRRMLSLVLISHVGYLIFGIALMAESDRALGATLMYMAQEMLVMAALFMCCGMIEKHTGSDDLNEIGGVLSRAPWLATAFFLCFASVVGIPPLPGFFGKFVLVTEGFRSDKWWISGLLTPAILVTAVLTMAVMVKIWAFAFWGEVKGRLLSLPHGAQAGALPPLGAAFAGVWMLLAVVGAVTLGSESYVNFTIQAAGVMAEPKPYVEHVLGEGTWPEPLHAETIDETRSLAMSALEEGATQ
ncbi:MAG: proton-conducting transporter membrane subunit [Phycisphaerales bacterium]